MALNFVISYTFAPNTTIASAQVNTNTSDVANVFTGLEALSKTFAKLKVDVDPATALEVATKQYVDHYSTYRRPVMQFVSTTTATIETGLSGVSGQALILFPDGTIRTDSTALHLVLDITRAYLLSGTKQSGVVGGAVTNNSWIAVYAVKATDNTTDFVAVGDPLIPVQANFAALNVSYGGNGWVYLGMIRVGDRSSVPSTILEFDQCGNTTILSHSCAGISMTSTTCAGFTIANAVATTVTYAISRGVGSAQVPNHVTHVLWRAGSNPVGAANPNITDSGGVRTVHQGYATSGFFVHQFWNSAGQGVRVTDTAGNGKEIWLSGWMDGSLGIGSNPLL